MTKSWFSWYWQLRLVGALAIVGTIVGVGDSTRIALFRLPAIAQIRPDATLGAESSQVRSNAPGAFQIDGGATRGTNLFHSFSQFSVPTNGAAFFNNAVNIQNIISRVTGGSVSNIDGLLKANGAANLFLINPNGIIFGPNARLNIGGSFVGSTTSSLKFADDTQFSATTPQTTPLLTISVPIGLQFGGSAGRILNQSQATDSNGNTVGLQVQQGKTLALVGGNVSLDGGVLKAPGGRVELGGSSGADTVGLNVDGNNLHLSFPLGVQRADVSLTNGAEVNVSAGGGGSIAINAQNLNLAGDQNSTLAGQSKLVAGIASGLGSADSKAGDIEINATGAITLTNGSFISNAVKSEAVGNGGDIKVTAGSLSLTNGAQLVANTFGRGDAGSVRVQASGAVSFDGEGILPSGAGVGANNTQSGAFSNVETGAVGKGGDINITAGSLSVTRGALLFAYTDGRGNAGNVNITARDQVSFDQASSSGSSSALFNNVETNGTGNAGDINIMAGSLSVTRGAQLQSLTRGYGNAGRLKVQASGPVSFNGVGSNNFYSTALVTVESGAVGNGGDINIKAGSLSLNDGAALSASTAGEGYAGNININVRDFVKLTNGTQLSASTSGRGDAGSVFVQANSPGKGDITNNPDAFRGGTINIQANTFDLSNGSQVLTLTKGTGRAGDINLKVLNNITLSGQDSALFASTTGDSTGNGGSIFIDPIKLAITGGASIVASSLGTGSAGNLRIQAGTVTLDGGASIIAATASGEGGIINLQAQDLLLMRHGSQISATALGIANGGNINIINTPFIVAVPSEQSNIIATAVNGRGGNIDITARGVFGIQPNDRDTSQSYISASSQLGINGTVQINTLDINPAQGLVALPVVPVDVTGLIAQGCERECGATSK